MIGSELMGATLFSLSTYLKQNKTMRNNLAWKYTTKCMNVILKGRQGSKKWPVVVIST